MKIRHISILAIFVSLIFACNSKQNKKGESGSNSTQVNEKTISPKKVNPIPKNWKPCEKLVTEIIITSPRYKQLTRGLNTAIQNNGGQSFGINLERSPNHNPADEENYSATYDFIVYEEHPDRQLTIARFSFDPKTKQLFEYDAVSDKLVKQEYNQDLLENIGKVCD